MEVATNSYSSIVVFLQYIYSVLAVVSTTAVSMAIKLGRMVTNLEGLLTIKSYNAFVPWSCKFTRQTKTTKSALTKCLWLPNLAGCSLWWDPVFQVRLHFDHLFIRDHVTHKSHFISIMTAPMTTRLGRVVTYLKVLLSFSHLTV